MKLLQELEHVRGRIALANCQPDVVLLFKMTRLDKLIPLYPSIAQASAKIINGAAA